MLESNNFAKINRLEINNSLSKIENYDFIDEFINVQELYFVGTKILFH